MNAYIVACVLYTVVLLVIPALLSILYFLHSKWVERTEWHVLLGETITSAMCKKIGHIRDYYWIYGDETCPRCSKWLNR